MLGMENGDQATLLPTVRWAQRKETLSLVVELQECQKPEITLEPGSMKFQATGVGAHGTRLYAFALDFFKPIDIESCVHKITGTNVQVHLTKDGAGEWWPRLISQKKSPHFLKLDFGRWKSESDDEEKEGKDEFDPSKLEDDLKRMKKAQETMRKGIDKYLLMYNATQYVAFAYIFLTCLIGLAMEGSQFFLYTYDRCGNVVHFAVMFSGMEIVHPAMGLVKGSWVSPLLQVAGRNFALFCLWLAVDHIKHRWFVTVLFMAWSASEVVRYPSYIVEIMNRTSNVLKWLRYTVWIPLYPIGVLAEMFVYVSAIAVFTENGLCQTTFTVPFNITVKMSWVIMLYLIGFPYGFLTLLRHMWKTRCKKLGRRKYKQP